MSVEQRSKNGDRRKPNYWDKTCSSATLSTENPTWTGSGSSPGLRGERSATAHLSTKFV